MGRAAFTKVVVGALSGALVFAAPAQADPASYLASLRKRGVYAYDMDDNLALYLGQWFCRQLQAGRPFNDAKSDLDDFGMQRATSIAVMSNVAGAAWNNLCREFEWEATHNIADYIPKNERTPSVK
ncbi:DUF732 domain-containing protein [Mycolicibacterium llatzerense]|uniref:DUF732 domain-containing protein n=1 Tax=Mycolicibacterium llatzerense TaxID=280871 RepID=UPI0009F54F18|nr:DUF732 domain-containing protein [Mycolicibacterium llatzerense]